MVSGSRGCFANERNKSNRIDKGFSSHRVEDANTGFGSFVCAHTYVGGDKKSRRHDGDRRQGAIHLRQIQ